MITIKQWMELVEYRITEGSHFCWDCYGDTAYTLDSWNGAQQGHSTSVVFDTETQEVYQVSVYDYSNDRAYRLINPLYSDAHNTEALQRNVDWRCAWDEVNYTDLEVEDDFLEKARAILSGEDYDSRVKVPLEFDREELHTLMLRAHEADMSLNQYVEYVLWNFINSQTEKQDGHSV